MSRIARNVCHQNVHPFQHESIVFRIAQPYVVGINVAIDRPQGFECLQLIGDLVRTDVAGVPYLITGFEVFKDPLVQYPVCVRQQADSFHLLNS